MENSDIDMLVENMTFQHSHDFCDESSQIDQK